MNATTKETSHNQRCVISYSLTPSSPNNVKCWFAKQFAKHNYKLIMEAMNAGSLKPDEQFTNSIEGSESRRIPKYSMQTR